jgi:hypothetical protein
MKNQAATVTTAATATVPTIKLELHQRTALDGVRDTETFNLIAYANCQLALGRPDQYATLIAKVEVDRPYIFAGSVEEWRCEVLRAAERKALEMAVPGVWEAQYGEILGEYYGV